MSPATDSPKSPVPELTLNLLKMIAAARYGADLVTDGVYVGNDVSWHDDVTELLYNRSGRPIGYKVSCDEWESVAGISLHDALSSQRYTDAINAFRGQGSTTDNAPRVEWSSGVTNGPLAAERTYPCFLQWTGDDTSDFDHGEIALFTDRNKAFKMCVDVFVARPGTGHIDSTEAGWHVPARGAYVNLTW